MRPTVRWSCLTVAALVASGCMIPLSSGTPPTTASKTRLTQAQGLAKLKASGKVQFSFKGLADRQTLATTADIDGVAIRLTTTGGVYGEVKQLDRQALLAPTVTVNFENVPAGEVTMEVRAFDRTGSVIGRGEQAAVVKAGQTSQIHLAVKLDALTTGSGSVAGTITFEPATYLDQNLTGQWVLGLGAEPPAGPVIGCAQPNVWTVRHDGDELYAITSGHNDARHPLHPNRDYVEIVQGKVQAGRFKLVGEVTYYAPNGRQVGGTERVDYDVAYQADSGHLAGTRNGQAGWAAPFMTDTACGDGLVSNQTPTPMPTGTPMPWTGPTPGPSASAPWWTSPGVAIPGPSATPAYANPYEGLTTSAYVGLIFDYYDRDHDGVLRYEAETPSDTAYDDETYRFVAVTTHDALGRAFTHATEYSIAYLLAEVDVPRDRRVNRDEFSRFVERFDANRDGLPDADYHARYGEATVGVQVY